MLSGAYAENNKADYFQKAGMVQLDYKASNKANVGSWGAYIAYRHLGGMLLLIRMSMVLAITRKAWNLARSIRCSRMFRQRLFISRGKISLRTKMHPNSLAALSSSSNQRLNTCFHDFIENPCNCGGSLIFIIVDLVNCLIKP